MAILFLAIHVLQILLRGATPAPTLYDQRQTGGSNVRIDVKDAVLIAIADDLGDYDYSYDYSDLTIKPEVIPTTSSKPTTTSTLAATTKPEVAPPAASSTAAAPNGTLVLDADNHTLTFPSSADATTDKVTVVHQQEQHIPVVVVEDATKKKLLPVKIFEKGHEPLRRCSSGFYRDDHNRCRRIRRPPRDKPRA